MRPVFVTRNFLKDTLDVDGIIETLMVETWRLQRAEPLCGGRGTQCGGG
jgi:hypothetical protein